jgi:hypothetical protein
MVAFVPRRPDWLGDIGGTISPFTATTPGASDDVVAPKGRNVTGPPRPMNAGLTKLVAKGLDTVVLEVDVPTSGVMPPSAVLPGKRLPGGGLPGVVMVAPGAKLPGPTMLPPGAGEPTLVIGAPGAAIPIPIPPIGEPGESGLLPVPADLLPPVKTLLPNAEGPANEVPRLPKPLPPKTLEFPAGTPLEV